MIRVQSPEGSWGKHVLQDRTAQHIASSAVCDLSCGQ